MSSNQTNNIVKELEKIDIIPDGKKLLSNGEIKM